MKLSAVASIEPRLERGAALLAGLLFFLSAAYGKTFAKVHLEFGPIPLYVSEITLLAIFALRASRVLALFREGGAFFWSVFAYILWGGVLLLAGFKQMPEVPRIDLLQNSAISWLAIWALVPFLFSEKRQWFLVSALLAGLGFSQLCAWISILLVGRIGPDLTFPLGYPAGNETVLALYPLAFVYWPRRWALVLSVLFGMLWLNQFVFYMKRTFVFSALFLVVPLVALGCGKGRVRFLSGIFGATAVGLALAWGTVFYLKSRSHAPLKHPIDGHAYSEQRAGLPLAVKAVLFPLDMIYAHSEPIASTGRDYAEIVLKGDRVRDGGGEGRTSFMDFRLHLWREAMEKFWASPLAGIGFNARIVETQPDGRPAIVGGKWVSGPHNSYISVLTRTGLIGFLLFALVHFFCFRQWVPLLRRNWRTGAPWLGAWLSLGFFCLFNVCLENPQSGIWYWLVVGWLARLAGNAALGDWKGSIKSV